MLHPSSLLLRSAIGRVQEKRLRDQRGFLQGALLKGTARCAACGSQSSGLLRSLRRGGRLFRCARCAHIQLHDVNLRADADSYAEVDPEVYRRSMEPERRASARALLERLAALGAEGPLLDVGCSFGWLLEEAPAHGFAAFGVEPSDSATAAAVRSGLSVRRGLFPQEDWNGRRWGVITYMDVLEHLPDVDSALAASVARLRDGGWLALRVPAASGAVFRTSSFIERASGGLIDGPLRRMLQTDYPYPHVHYFGRASLGALLERHGLRTVETSFHPIASGNFVDRVAFRSRPTPGERVVAAGLNLVVRAGNVVGRGDILQALARVG